MPQRSTDNQQDMYSLVLDCGLSLTSKGDPGATTLLTESAGPPNSKPKLQINFKLYDSMTPLNRELQTLSPSPGPPIVNSRTLRPNIRNAITPAHPRSGALSPGHPRQCRSWHCAWEITPKPYSPQNTRTEKFCAA